MKSGSSNALTQLYPNLKPPVGTLIKSWKGLEIREWLSYDRCIASLSHLAFSKKTTSAASRNTSQTPRFNLFSTHGHSCFPMSSYAFIWPPLIVSYGQGFCFNRWKTGSKSFFSLWQRIQLSIWVRSEWVSETPLWDLTDVTLAGNSRQCGNAVMQPGQPMQVTPPDDQILNPGMLCWPNLQLMQMAPSGGQICNQCQ